VEVAEQAVPVEVAIVRVIETEVAGAGAEVEQDRFLARRLDGDARRVAADARDIGPVARCRPTDAVERDAQHFPLDGRTS
jgi:hypothetical protein